VIKKLLKNNKRKVIGIIAFSLLVYAVFGLTSLYTTRVILKQNNLLHNIGEMAIPQRGQNILVFSPHQDDETLGIGGYVATAIKNGANVDIVLVTDGNRYKIKAIRYREFLTATKTLGVTKDHLTYLQYPDGSVKNQPKEKLKNEFKKIIDEKNPDILISPFSGDQHPDHAVTGQIVEEITKDKGVKLYEYVVHDKNFPQNTNFSPKYFLLPPANLASMPGWQKFILEPGIEKLKSKAIASYRSQMFSGKLQNIFRGLVRRNELFLEMK
jgi:LmbE family N-acetylglucosaminyl deacetylase